MKVKSTILFRLFTLVIALQVLNVSTNISDSLIGKNGPGHNFVNEIETMIELVAEVMLHHVDAIPETHIPGGTLGFEEEEKHFLEDASYICFEKSVPDVLIYSSNSYQTPSFSNYICEVLTPPPRS